MCLSILVFSVVMGINAWVSFWAGATYTERRTRKQVQ